MQSAVAPLDLYAMPDDRVAAEAAVIAAINTAKSSYYEMIYEFGDEDYAQALAAAFKRGVDVMLLIDHVQSTGTKPKQCIQDMISWGLPKERIGITTSIFKQIMHNKLGIVDGDAGAGFLIEGSLNWSADALKQDNTMLVIHSPELATARHQAFKEHFAWTMANEAALQLK